MEGEDEIRRHLEELFPNLRGTAYRITSPASRVYNCIAWAAGDTERWWWPTELPGPGYFWPPEAPRELTLAAFVTAFASLGFGPADDAGPVSGVEKVALFTRHDEPTHAARQAGEWWSSKLGKFVDIEHTLEGLAGDVYGAVALILQRPLSVLNTRDEPPA